MKALVIAERADAARELAAGARTMADEVVLVAIRRRGPADGVADKVVRIDVPAGAARPTTPHATVISVFDAEQPAVVLGRAHAPREGPSRARWPRMRAPSVITDVMSFEGAGATQPVLRRRGRARAEGRRAAWPSTPVGAGVFEGVRGLRRRHAVEEVAWVAPASPRERCVSWMRRPCAQSGVDLGKADVVVAAGRGFAEEADLDLARALC